ncbi:MAG TPA: NAD(P)-dependent oxidoreductase [Micromonosporaceae bacterium]
MRVLVAGATGVIGRQLVPLLVSVGHEVVGLARSPRRIEPLREAGATVVYADALDRAALLREVDKARPDAVVHLLTAIPDEMNPRRLMRGFALTNRLRTEGTRNLLDAAANVGARRVVTQGVAFAYDPAGNGPANEDEPLWRNPPRAFAPVLDALRELERLTGDAGGLVLRFGHLYGPGSTFAPDGSMIQQVRQGKMPLVGAGDSVFSFTHAHDAATAIVAALDRDVRGVLNVVDDDPTPIGTWLPELARMIGAPRPKSVPKAIARLAAGGWGVAYLSELRGADNARARLRLDWRPRYLSWRDGFAADLTGTVETSG